MKNSSKPAFIATGRSEVQIGSKATTLYLSSSSLKLHDKRCHSRESTNAGPPLGTGSLPQSPVQSETDKETVAKPGTAPGRSTAYSQRSEREDNPSRGSVSRLQPIREFTFTGYDIMADGTVSYFYTKSCLLILSNSILFLRKVWDQKPMILW